MPELLPTEKITKRICGFDLAETIAALMVVTYHISTCSYLLLQDYRIGTVLTTCFRSFLVMCVPLFLMINGYLLLHKPLDLKRHLLRTLRLAILAVFWCIPPMLMYLRLMGRTIGVLDFVHRLITVLSQGYSAYGIFSPVIQVWYLAALVCVYLLLPMLHVAFREHRDIFYIFLAVAAVCSVGLRAVNQAITLIDWFGPRTITTESHYNVISAFNPLVNTKSFPFFYFYLGGLLPEIQGWLTKHLPRHSTRNLLLTVIMFFAAAVHTLWFLFIYKKSGNYICPVWYGYNTVSAAVLSLSALLLILDYQGRPVSLQKVLRLVSENSLGIYLMHMPFVLVLRIYLPVWCPWLCSQGGNILAAIVVIAVCIPISCLIRRIPGVRQLLKP